MGLLNRKEKLRGFPCLLYTHAPHTHTAHTLAHRYPQRMRTCPTKRVLRKEEVEILRPQEAAMPAVVWEGVGVGVR